MSSTEPKGDRNEKTEKARATVGPTGAGVTGSGGGSGVSLRSVFRLFSSGNSHRQTSADAASLSAAKESAAAVGHTTHSSFSSTAAPPLPPPTSLCATAAAAASTHDARWTSSSSSGPLAGWASLAANREGVAVGGVGGIGAAVGGVATSSMPLSTLESWAREIDAAHEMDERVARLDRLLNLLPMHPVLPQGGSGILWMAARDLMRPEQPAGVRARVFRLMSHLLVALDPDDRWMRLHFFEVRCVGVGRDEKLQMKNTLGLQSEYGLHFGLRREGGGGGNAAANMIVRMEERTVSTNTDRTRKDGTQSKGGARASGAVNNNNPPPPSPSPGPAGPQL